MDNPLKEEVWVECGNVSGSPKPQRKIKQHKV